jgi:Fe-S-cluster containining protein
MSETVNTQAIARLEKICRTHPEIMKIEARAARIQSANMRFETKSQRLYALADEMKGMLEPFVVCKSGCSHCCRMPTMIYLHEAKRMAQTSGRQYNFVPPSPLPMALARARAFNGNPCPFLQNDQCSIYEDRPLICRLHNSLNDDPLDCKVHVEGRVGHLSSFNPDWVEMPYLYSVLAWNPREPYAVIQEFFPLDQPGQDIT